MSMDKDHDPQPNSRWFAPNASKSWAEKFYLIYSLYWVGIMAWIVASKFYEQMEEWEYMYVGLFIAVPGVLYPLLFPGEADRKLPLCERYWVKATIWISIMSYIGNYLWTHYFYKLLGATYTFKAHRLNDVPFALYLITFAYFQLYHHGVNVLLRRFCYGSIAAGRSRSFSKHLGPLFVYAFAVFVLASVTAFMETWTIKEFPYYTFKDRDMMYKVGTFCYAIYFYVSFPMFYRMEERVGDRWTLSQATIDSLACCMLVTMILDAWRLSIGQIFSEGGDAAAEVPWIN